MKRLFLSLYLFTTIIAQAQTPVDPRVLDSLARSMEQDRARVSGRQDSLERRLDSVQKKQQLAVAKETGRLKVERRGEQRVLAYILTGTGLLLLAGFALRRRRRKPS